MNVTQRCKMISNEQGARFSHVPKTFRLEKPFVKFRLFYSVKLFFSYVVKGMKILTKSRLHDNVSFVLPSHQKSSRHRLRKVCHPYTALLRFVMRIFSLKHHKKKQGKERETGCFQSKVANYVSTKTRPKAKYQTSRGQNSSSSSFSFSDLKLLTSWQQDELIRNRSCIKNPTLVHSLWRWR